MKKFKVCPLRCADKTKPIAYCMGDACAWWCDWAKECAIPLTAGILADSSICQNTWND